MLKSETKIVYLEDHTLVGKTLLTFLRDNGYNQVSLFERVDTFLESVLLKTANVVLLDIRIGEKDVGFELIKEVRALNPKAKIIMLTMHASYADIQTAIEEKVNGYLTKEEEPKTLLKAIDSVLNNKTYYSDQVMVRMVSRDQKTLPSKKELKVLHYLNEAKNSKEIAQLLQISPYTVDSHKQNLMIKSNTKSVQELLRYYRKERIIKDS